MPTKRGNNLVVTAEEKFSEGKPLSVCLICGVHIDLHDPFIRVTISRKNQKGGEGLKNICKRCHLVIQKVD